MNEQISRFLDGDLSTVETRNLLEQVAQQPELKATLIRYATIRHAMQHDDFLWISTDFSNTIQQKIQQSSVPYTTPRLAHRYYWFALAAASLAALAVFAEHHVVEPVDYSTSLQLAQQAKPAQVQSDCEKSSQIHAQTANTSNNQLVKLANYCK